MFNLALLLFWSPARPLRLKCRERSCPLVIPSCTRSTACPWLSFGAAVAAGGSGAMGWLPGVSFWVALVALLRARHPFPAPAAPHALRCPSGRRSWQAVRGRGGRWLFRSSLVPCGSGNVLALLGSLVCFAALVVLRAWRPCPALRGMCAHAACPGGVPHARSTTSAAFACACLIWRCAFFILIFSDLALLCFSKRLGPRCAGGAWGPHILAVVRSDFVQLHSHS